MLRGSQDVVERFHLVCILVFVVVEDMASSGTWAPSSVILKESIGILGAEVVIDIVKHAVLGKFNNVRPGIYREYMKVHVKGDCRCAAGLHSKVDKDQFCKRDALFAGFM